ncbi:MAG: hypothetical protein Kow00108_02650 [Calditrichia bacterium]
MNGFTRSALLEYFKEAILKHARYNLVIIGLDFSFSFPDGFFEQINGYAQTNIMDVFSLIPSVEPDHFSAIDWAMHINHHLENTINFAPFWGPSFAAQKHKPLSWPTHFFPEKRTCEMLIPKTHSIFQLGGHGSVGLQSIHGLLWVKQLSDFCKSNRISMQIWPSTGSVQLQTGVLLLETYPGILNTGIKSDHNDALSICQFLKSTFIDTDDYLIITETIEKNVSKQVLQREGFIYGPLEKIFTDSVPG